MFDTCTLFLTQLQQYCDIVNTTFCRTVCSNCSAFALPLTADCSNAMCVNKPSVTQCIDAGAGTGQGLSGRPPWPTPREPSGIPYLFLVTFMYAQLHLHSMLAAYLSDGRIEAVNMLKPGRLMLCMLMYIGTYCAVHSECMPAVIITASLPTYELYLCSR